MKIFHHDRNTGELIGETEARPNPLDDTQFLIPAHATDIPPPAIRPGLVPVFNSGVWTQATDNRGTIWYDETGEAYTIDTLDTDVPAGTARVPRPSTNHRLARGVWVQGPPLPPPPERPEVTAIKRLAVAAGIDITDLKL